MRTHKTIYENHLRALVLLPALCAVAQTTPSPESTALRPGLIASDTGGAPGYQHGLKQSHFVVGAQPRTVTEAGWSKQQGTDGAFAVSLHNGVAMALPNARPNAYQKPLYTKDPSDHEKQVLEYFTSAGIPKDQIGGVHTMTRLSSSGHYGDAHPSPPRVDSYISVLERKVDGYPVPDSVAWAQFDNEGHVISEGVYWPALPASAIRDAGRIKSQLASTSDRSRFLAQIPATLPSGQVAIRHTSASDQQAPFEAVASYDVLEKKTSAPAAGATAAKSAGENISIMRHFDANGVEQRLPQEKRNAEKEYPAQKKEAPAPGPAH
jgi:hypothetical protein